MGRHRDSSDKWGMGRPYDAEHGEGVDEAMCGVCSSRRWIWQVQWGESVRVGDDNVVELRRKYIMGKGEEMRAR